MDGNAQASLHEARLSQDRLEVGDLRLQGNVKVAEAGACRHALHGCRELSCQVLQVATDEAPHSGDGQAVECDDSNAMRPWTDGEFGCGSIVTTVGGFVSAIRTSLAPPRARSIAASNSAWTSDRFGSVFRVSRS